MHTKSQSPVFSTQLFADTNSFHFTTINYLQKKKRAQTKQTPIPVRLQLHGIKAGIVFSIQRRQRLLFDVTAEIWLLADGLFY
jgi:hypothetical protein